MRRALLHILFWVVYLLQDTLLEYKWIVPSLRGFTPEQQVWVSVETTLCILLPKLLFTYFLLEVTVKQALTYPRNFWRIGTEALAAFLVAVLLNRVISNYFIIPVLYKGTLPVYPLLETSRLLLTVMDVGFVAGIAAMLKLLRVQVQKEEKEKLLVKEKLETELKFLRNQINPHFLFNTLNNIYALARKKSDNTPEIVMKLSKLLRFMLYESRKDLIPIAEEIKMLNDCLELERIRYNERLTITFEKQVDNGQQLIAPLLLLPFIENAFKHGVSETRFESFIHIALQLKTGQLNFRVENTKENGTPGAITDNIGLGNVRRQLELMYKDYHLQVDNEASVFKVHLHINLNSHAKI
ncbi:sensor histidine kinase [Chitinophaga vietnamensis]|uniref:sensor histidine kinase n=1 Tax=Chitinophaga vietnamensis TaxID=2593957 RepID=UPI0011786954|nr:histidine kinase [Chitinophaga vietnamensis]